MSTIERSASFSRGGNFLSTVLSEVSNAAYLIWLRRITEEHIVKTRPIRFCQEGSLAYRFYTRMDTNHQYPGLSHMEETFQKTSSFPRLFPVVKKLTGILSIDPLVLHRKIKAMNIR